MTAMPTDTDVRVLVVHTHTADLAVVASVVAAHAFDLRVLEPAADVPAEVARYRPDAVVLDVEQPRGDGYALCRALKSDPATAPVPVILIGSESDAEARRRAFAVGCDDFLDKPINRHVLAHRLRSFARLRRAWAASSFSLRGRTHANDRLIRSCDGFGRYLGLSDTELLALEQAAVLRDIIEVHPEIGAELLQRLPGLTPQVARVFRVLDRLDRLTNDAGWPSGSRPGSQPTGDALVTLAADAAVGQIDPAVVGKLTSWLQAENP